jgi:hypothetical protein
MWQQGVLLSLVKAMDLVDKQEGPLPVSVALRAGRLDDGANLLHPGEDGA